jgi:hypothetical protein
MNKKDHMTSTKVSNYITVDTNGSEADKVQRIKKYPHKHNQMKLKRR